MRVREEPVEPFACPSHCPGAPNHALPPESGPAKAAGGKVGGCACAVQRRELPPPPGPPMLCCQVLTIYLSKQAGMEWWDCVAEGEPKIGE